VIGKRRKGIPRRMGIFSVSMKEVQDVRVQVDVFLLLVQESFSKRGKHN